MLVKLKQYLMKTMLFWMSKKFLQILKNKYKRGY